MTSPTLQSSRAGNGSGYQSGSGSGGVDTSKPGSAARFFWRLAGADPDVLGECTYPEQVRYASIGGMVLATGLLGGAAMYCALYTTVGNPKLDAEDRWPWWLISVLSVLWGAMVLNLDRFLVSGTSRGDGTESIQPWELVQASPRFLMAVVLSYVISTPLELWIFKGELDLWVSQKQNEEMTITQNGFRATRAPELEYLRGVVRSLEAEIAGAKSRKEAYLDEARRQRAGEGDRDPTCGRKCLEAERAAAVEAERIRPVQEKIDSTNARIAALEKEIADSTTSGDAKSTAAKSGGLLLRIQLLQQKAPGVSRAVFAVFLVVEMAPILFKMMMAYGPYDYIMDHRRRLLRAQNGIEVTGEGWQERRVFFGEAAILSRRQREQAAQQQVEEAALRAWVEERLRDNPARYVRDEPHEPGPQESEQ